MPHLKFIFSDRIRYIQKCPNMHNKSNKNGANIDFILSSCGPRTIESKKPGACMQLQKRGLVFFSFWVSSLVSWKRINDLALLKKSNKIYRRFFTRFPYLLIPHLIPIRCLRSSLALALRSLPPMASLWVLPTPILPCIDAYRRQLGSKLGDTFSRHGRLQRCGRTLTCTLMQMALRLPWPRLTHGLTAAVPSCSIEMIVNLTLTRL